MALTERTEEDQIEIVGEFRHVQVRTSTIIERDGEEVSRTHHRRTLAPDADLAAESPLVRDIATAAWTQQVKDAWAAHLQATSTP